jgi:hypothetical protein
MIDGSISMGHNFRSRQHEWWTIVLNIAVWFNTKIKVIIFLWVNLKHFVIIALSQDSNINT